MSSPAPSTSHNAANSTQAFSLKTRRPIDEDDLLTAEDREAKSTVEKLDCATRRRACKNCTCGRAELERQLEAGGSQVMGAMPPGGCGNCAKGDAFRCAGCPYLGMPAFDNAVDGKVKLDLTDDI
ncbi:Cytokine-induced anti-apoptosis inhibitor 1, Fe-S biogenesis, putative [Trypanosoma equiperdum]|uniref:Anamorsin homolog n=5 Tax=Trypanozoon TaxID=39700 RepID=DRE2_TRYB2|nr:hypothetical protein, conserved [Trypanosoma brucei gambiense DAL972]XP_847008.1 hypothetical protein, conserved [Trypanosoma brucei brucei TREU927]C9ZUU9.1 RecName: Full=Anamorsin homolog; AltName: Full=Fe-S cluster assembly protein DRE2 homolog [Trypanosoma brucei gambiense DAL972]Q582A7.1 RecName: Full=Anamorsin homolog; AltName: Full=Fe-S cluster assembly protein DRE2 homolog [Trypanosoma brucei brucei TREU927]AAX79396.1 hypothetical protein, conserved [Trypanosoma brucei]RHW70725.1 Cyt|eukprot:XP_011775464.1 hypothetical protein, conserved [Trypanosoma brucei gambiense DAL972]